MTIASRSHVVVLLVRAIRLLVWVFFFRLLPRPPSNFTRATVLLLLLVG
jgi:hypothetical protein